MNAHVKLAYQCECPACGAEPGALCERITVRTTMQLGRVHDERLDVALELHRSRHPDEPCIRCGQTTAHVPGGPNTYQLAPPHGRVCQPCRARATTSHPARCPRCGQTSMIYGEVCDTCRAADREPQGSQLGFQLGVPTITTGQASLDVG